MHDNVEIEKRNSATGIAAKFPSLNIRYPDHTALCIY